MSNINLETPQEFKPSPDFPTMTKSDSTKTLKSKRKHTWILFSLLVIMLLVLGTVSVVLVRLNSLYKSFGAQTFLYHPTPTPKKEISNLSDWQTYRNEEYGFEFKYPPDWYIENINIPASENDFSFYIKPKIYFIAQPIIITGQILKAKVAEYTFQFCCKKNRKDTLGNNEFYTNDTLQLEGMVEWIYYTGDKDNLAKFSLGIGNRSDPPPLPSAESYTKELQDYFQILSTFRFVKKDTFLNSCKVNGGVDPCADGFTCYDSQSWPKGGSKG